MKSILLTLALCASGITASAQTLSFCSAYLPDGTPQGESTEWNMYSGGGNVYLLYKQSAALPAEGLRFVIEREDDGEFLYSGASNAVPTEGANWAFVDYHFTEKGNYKVTVKNGSEVLSSSELSLSFLRAGTDYSSSSMVFCTKVTSGAPEDTLRTLSLVSESVKARAFVHNPDNLNCNRLVVDIWKKNGDSFKEYIATKKFEVEPGWLFTQFSYEIKEAGQYKFMVYSDSGVWINSGEIEVTK